MDIISYPCPHPDTGLTNLYSDRSLWPILCHYTQLLNISRSFHSSLYKSPCLSCSHTISCYLIFHEPTVLINSQRNKLTYLMLFDPILSYCWEARVWHPNWWPWYFTRPSDSFLIVEYILNLIYAQGSRASLALVVVWFIPNSRGTWDWRTSKNGQHGSYSGVGR